MIALVGGIIKGLPYAVLMTLMLFQITENCGFRCEDHFEHLSTTDEPITIYAEKPTGHLVIAEKDAATQIGIYIPSKTQKKVSINAEKIQRNYTKSRKKAKLVNFSDFKKQDPVLSEFNDEEQPYIPQKPCPLEKIPNIID